MPVSAEGRVEHQKLNQTTPRRRNAFLVEFLVFNSVYWKKSAPSNGVNRVDKRCLAENLYSKLNDKPELKSLKI